MSDPQSPREGLDAGPRPAATWPWIALLACAVVICGYAGNALAVLGPRLPGHFGITMESLGLLFGAPLLAAIIPHAIAGPASDRWGAKTTLLAAPYGASPFHLPSAARESGAPWWQRDLRVPMAIFPLGRPCFPAVETIAWPPQDANAPLHDRWRGLLERRSDSRQDSAASIELQRKEMSYEVHGRWLRFHG